MRRSVWALTAPAKPDRGPSYRLRRRGKPSSSEMIMPKYLTLVRGGTGATPLSRTCARGVGSV